MAIQFRCSHCSQPIEVDDLYAGQVAICPYCRQEVGVPMESDLGSSPAAVPRAEPLAPEPEQAGPAPPTGQEVPPSPPPGVPPPVPPMSGHVPGAPPGESPQAEAQQSARRWGNLALICAAVAVLCFGFVVIYQVVELMPVLQQGQQPTPQQQMEVAQKPATIFGSLAAMLSSVVGLVLSVVSLRHERSGNWRAYVALSICGLFVLCNCSSALVGALGGFGAAAGG